MISISMLSEYDYEEADRVLCGIEPDTLLRRGAGAWPSTGAPTDKSSSPDRFDRLMKINLGIVYRS